MGLLIDYFQGLNTEDRIDQEIVNTITRNNTSSYRTAGIWKRMAQIDPRYGFVYIPWNEDGISYGKVSPNFDILSLPFSGCYLARVSGMGALQYGYHKDCVNWGFITRAIAKF